MAAGADELRSLPPECVRLIIEAGSESKLLDTPGRLRKADLLAFARVNSMWQGCAMEELVRHLYLEQWNPQFEDWMGDSLPSRVETLTLGRNADLDSSEQRGWLGEQVDAVTRLCGAKLKEVTISGSDDLSIENLACLQKLEALHLNLAGHYKMKDYARAANITSSFANLHRLSLVDVPLLDIAAIFAAGDSFPSLRHLVLVRPQLAHPMHPFERAPSGSRIGPQLTALVVGQNWQHALGSRSLAEFTALESFSIIGSAGMDAGGFRPIEVIKAPLRRLTLAHAMAEDGFLASLRKNPISVSRLEKLNLLSLDDGASDLAIGTRKEIESWARDRGCEVHIRVEPVMESGDLAELELRILTGPIDEIYFLGRPPSERASTGTTISPAYAFIDH